MAKRKKRSTKRKPATVALRTLRVGTDAAATDEIQAAMLQSERLVRLVSFPLTVVSNVKPEPRVHDNWDVVAPAMLFSASSCLLSIRLLAETAAPRREQDAIVLLRRLYEHVVDLAWIAIDPATHAKKWVADDWHYRLKIDDDFVKLGQRGLTAQQRTNFQQFVAAHGRMPDMASRADAADKHWSKLIAGHGVFPTKPASAGSTLSIAQQGLWSLRTQYTIVYRLASANAHPTALSLERYIVAHGNSGKFTIGMNPDELDRYAYTLAPIIFATMLIIAENVLGYPRREDVEHVFDEVASMFVATRSGGGT